jgi:hypothetical protein
MQEGAAVDNRWWLEIAERFRKYHEKAGENSRDKQEETAGISRRKQQG